jgi:hypothetical protein
LQGVFCFVSDAAGQGPTLVIVRSTNGFTFGGYAAADWNNNPNPIPARGSFVFWVENPQGRAPGCLDCVNPAQALHGGSNNGNGPYFCGVAGSVAIRGTTNYSTPNATYPDTTGLGNALFTGAPNFNLEDYEVWAVT